MKFLTDRSLGKLTKWLLILGYDTLSHKGDADRMFLKRAQAEGRVALTRKRDLAGRQFMGRMMLIEDDRVENQIPEIIKRFSLDQDPRKIFSRCIKCNEDLVPIGKDRVKGKVPEYTFDTQNQFMTCRNCGAIYWPGTHRERAEGFFRTRILKDRP
jgi:uncharacterized protein with PIN domain